MTDARPVLPWLSWAALPGLGVPRVLAKLDTGARGTVIHATDIAVEGTRVGFTLHPLPDRPEVVVRCEAALADRRTVTNSGGASELRPFIHAGLILCDLPVQTVEISLTERSSMRFRMLVGRDALAGWGALVDPGATVAGVLRKARP